MDKEGHVRSRRHRHELEDFVVVPEYLGNFYTVVAPYHTGNLSTFGGITDFA